MVSSKTVICIGGGPAGLTASYLLSKEGVAVTVLESDPRYWGGISRTVEYKGFLFDIGGHRFFSKSREVEDFWTEILGSDLLERPRSSRIYYRKKFFSYPLRPLEAFFGLGAVESLHCLLSYLRARIAPVKNPACFEDWVSNQFGKRLFSIFFKSYTEKVWGMSTREISSDWAAQRIKGLSLGKAVWDALRPGFLAPSRARMLKTLIGSFRYPRKGPGMMWEAVARKTQEQGGVLRLGCRATRVSYLVERKKFRVSYQNADGREDSLEADEVVSSAPIRDLLQGLEPIPKSRAAAESLRYRDFLIVSLIIRERSAFTDNWLYIHEPEVKVGRIQNFKSWSPELVPDPNLNCLGLEYFCFEGDGLWNMPDSELVALAKRELVSLGLVVESDILDGCVIRQTKAYPVYDAEYLRHLEEIRRDLGSNYPGLHLVGRNGMHRYDNQDHAMMTAMLTVKNILAGKPLFDVWKVNEDAEYLEEGGASGLRAVPSALEKPGLTARV